MEKSASSSSPAPRPTVASSSTLAVVSGSFLSGAMASLSAFVIPVLLETNTDNALHTVRQWTVLYGYGRTYMPALAVGTCGLHLLSCIKGPTKDRARNNHLLAAAVTIGMVPFTWFVMAPTNSTLFGILEKAVATGSGIVDAAWVRRLAVRWAFLHLARSLFPLVGVFVGLSTVLGE